jgi:hypothetical protein
MGPVLVEFSNTECGVPGEVGETMSYVEVPPEGFPADEGSLAAPLSVPLTSVPAPFGGRVAQGGAEDQQNTGRIYANVPSIFSDVKLYGCDHEPTDQECGKIIKKVQCSHDPTHRSYYFKHRHCNNPFCPVCYTKFAARLANRVTSRIEAGRSVYHLPVYHLILWRDNKTVYRDMKEAMADGWKMARDAGVIAGGMFWHPARIRKDIKDQLWHYRRSRGLSSRTGFWEIARDDVLNLGSLAAYCVRGDHFHMVASGYLENSKAYFERTGCGYKKGRTLPNESEVRKTAYYLATHAAYQPGKHSAKYYGLISYSKLGKTKVYDRIEDVMCEVCGARMESYEANEDGTIVGGDNWHVTPNLMTHRVQEFKYWKRVKK